MSQSPTGFVADVALRTLLPPARRGRARLGVAILLALLLEAGVFAVVWRERNFVPVAPQEEIPVEIVVEPSPTPTPPPPPPPPEMKTQDDYEKPATDAPREGKSDHDDEHVGEKPKDAAAPPPSPEATPSPEASKPVETPAPTPSPEASKAPETPAPELPQTAEAEAPPPKPVEPAEAPPPPPKSAAAKVLAKSFEDVPDVDFGGEAIKSPITGGNAKATYFSMLYGLIVPRLHVPAIAHAYGRRLNGSINFTIDGKGRLVQRYVSSGSGSMEFDEAAMQAVGAASKLFPPPPHGAPISITFNYEAQ